MSIPAVAPAAGQAQRPTLAGPRPLAILWAVMVAALAAFLFFGVMRIGAGNWIGRSRGVRQIWTTFLNYLTDLGASPAIVLLVVAAAGIALVGAGYGLWLAFTLEDPVADPLPDDVA